MLRTKQVGFLSARRNLLKFTMIKNWLLVLLVLSHFGLIAEAQAPEAVIVPRAQFVSMQLLYLKRATDLQTARENLEFCYGQLYPYASFDTSE